MIKTKKNESLRKREHKIFGRPQMNAEEHRSIKVSVFLTKSESEKLKEKAAETLLTLPELLRRAALGRQIEKRKSVFDAEAVSEIRQCVQMIRKLSNEISLLREDNLKNDRQYFEKILQENLRILNAINKNIIEV